LSFASVTNSTFSIGVDGGGTKTDLILVDAEGNVVARHTGPGCSPSHVGVDRARTILTEALVALRGGRTVERTRLFMAGSPAAWHEIASAIQGFGTIRTDNDALPVLELATGGAPGLVLHAGTGSFVAARAPDGSVHYAGGLGWKFGDPGSGYDLGRRGVAHALIELQGWSPASGLGEALRKHSGLQDAPTITRWLYANPEANAQVAAFGRRVLELAQEGCRPAQDALAGSLTELAMQARLVSEKLFPGAETVICGVSGAILNVPVSVHTFKALAQTHHWRVDYRFITEPPIEGVRRLLLRG
jgi:glucosamine kinase